MFFRANRAESYQHPRGKADLPIHSWKFQRKDSCQRKLRSQCTLTVAVEIESGPLVSFQGTVFLPEEKETRMLR